MSGLTQEQLDVLTQLLDGNSDRFGFYYQLAQYYRDAGAPSAVVEQVLVQSEIASASGLIGGAGAVAVSYIRQQAGYDEFGNLNFSYSYDDISHLVASRILEAIERDLDRDGDGIFTVDELLELDYSVWRGVGVGEWFLGNVVRGDSGDGLPADSIVLAENGWWLTPEQTEENRYLFAQHELGFGIALFADDLGGTPEKYGFSNYEDIAGEIPIFSDDGQYALELASFGRYLIRDATTDGIAAVRY